ncbi:DUF1059 domain-containing protein [Halobacterium wangiae]|uniref:DUF1059 domain-containing protein n=1 Tax=Halobacterium wangiae TaxID=2902623 RepID=UPI001E624353|nr:DUF1059 domain-containing protein [Halobacterium wangiae]
MVQAHNLDRDAAAADCRFVVHSENEAEAIELANNHMRDAHGKNLTDEQLRSEHLQTV